MKTSTAGVDRVVKGLYFLMAPEDSSTAPSIACPVFEKLGWHRAKALLWIVFSVVAALLIGQL